MHAEPVVGNKTAPAASRLHVYLGEVQLEDETKLGQTAQQVMGMVSQVEPFGCMQPVNAPLSDVVGNVYQNYCICG